MTPNAIGRRAVSESTAVAEAPSTQTVDGHEYFKPEEVRWDYLVPSDRTTVCGWKGTAGYWDVVVDGDRLPAAAWSYQDPSAAAQHIKGHVAFWRGVKVVPAE